MKAPMLVVVQVMSSDADYAEKTKRLKAKFKLGK
jgi:hypothetical protein